MDGVVECEGIPMRQVPSRTFPFGHSTWASEEGLVRNRYYNAFSSTWSWSKPRQPVFDSRGRLGYYVYGRFRVLAHVVALAWVPRHRPMYRLQRVRRKNVFDNDAAYNLAWCDEESDCSSGEDTDVPDSPSDDDESGYRPLKFKMGLIPCVSENLRISSRGKLKTPRGIFRGTYALGPSRFYPIPFVGLVPLDLAGQLLFSGHRDRSRDTVPPRIVRTMRLLRSGHNVASIARCCRVKETTAWSYAHTAMQHMSTSSARRITEGLLDDAPSVLAALSKLAQETPFVVSGKLSDVVHLLTRLFAAQASWREYPHRYSVVCLARSLLQREI